MQEYIDLCKKLIESSNTEEIKNYMKDIWEELNPEEKEYCYLRFHKLMKEKKQSTLLKENIK